MNPPKRPFHEVAEAIKRFGPAFRARGNVPVHHLRTLSALERCRTAALGGHLDACTACGVVSISYNSCRNRHCPKCGGLERELWIQARCQELLPIRYYHVVFTLPAQFNDWCMHNDAFCYDLLFKAAWHTLRTFAKDNRLLGAKTGATMVLHTWGQNLSLHPHVHCIVPGGGLTAQGRWQQPKKAGKRGFLFPVRAMSQVFKAFYLKHFMAVWNKGLLTIPPDAPTGYPEAARWRQARWSQDWVVYAKAPFNGPQTVIEYLGRYTHKVAISNHRLVDITPQQVIFRYKDYRREAKVGLMVLDGVEFLRRFCLHILPPGFRRLRHYGILANFHKAHALQAARSSLGVSEELMPPKLDKATLKAGLLARWFDHRTTFCPHCGAHNTIVRMLLAPNSARAPPIRSAPVSNITH